MPISVLLVDIFSFPRPSTVIRILTALSCLSPQWKHRLLKCPISISLKSWLTGSVASLVIVVMVFLLANARLSTDRRHVWLSWVDSLHGCYFSLTQTVHTYLCNITRSLTGCTLRSAFITCGNLSNFCFTTGGYFCRFILHDYFCTNALINRPMRPRVDIEYSKSCFHCFSFMIFSCASSRTFCSFLPCSSISLLY